MANEKGQAQESFGHRKRVDFDDPIAQLVEKMVKELEARADWRGWELEIFKKFPTKYKKRGPNKGQPTESSELYNNHYNSLFAVAVQALKEGYRLAQGGQHLLVVEAELIAEAAWPEEKDHRQDDDRDWWGPRNHAPWGYL